MPTRAPARSCSRDASRRGRYLHQSVRRRGLGASRNGQGVDYDPLKVEPIRAIGAGTIVAIGSWGSYAPWFDHKLADGPFVGRCIYVAEHIGSILSLGTSFNAGDTLATAYSGPDWTEWG